MVKLKLIEKTEEFVKYFYYPEGEEFDAGEIIFNFKTNKVEHILFSEKEQNSPLQWYAKHAYLAVKNYAETNDFKKEDIRIWH